MKRLIRSAFGFAASLAVSFGLAGCGGSTTDTSDAVVQAEPGTSAAPGGGGSPALAPTPAPAATKEAAPAAASTAPTKAEGWGTLKGKITFGADAPAIPVLQEKGKAEKDPTVCATDASIVSERLIVDGASKGVKNVLVYIPKPTAVNEEAKSAKASTEVLFDQVKCVFEPHVLGVLAGSKITLKSSDTVQHNINAKLQKNAAFNQILGGGQTTSFPTTTGERVPVPVTCDIHPWMQGWWMVLDNPYFAVTDKEGNFEIKNAPAGTQKVVVWQEATGFVTPPSGEDVTVAVNDPTAKNWTIDPSKVKPAK